MKRLCLILPLLFILFCDDEDKRSIPPTPVGLFPVEYKDGTFIILWDQYYNEDFSKYELYESMSEDMNNKTLIYQTQEITTISYVVTGIVEGETRYYQIFIENLEGLKSESNIRAGYRYPGITFGGNERDYGKSILKTPDGGFIILSNTYSFGNGLRDFWLIKTDASGLEEWNQTFGGRESDISADFQQTTDGGFIIVGSTSSFGSTNTEDVWLIKTDSNGEEEWNKTFGGNSIDRATSLQQTSDGGYIIIGYTYSFGNGHFDFWLIKTDSNGEEEWNKTFGGDESDTGNSVKQTLDGGFIIVGNTYSFGNGEGDAWLIKTDSNGEEEWNKTFGGKYSDASNSIQLVPGNGYIIAGNTVIAEDDPSDVWLIKTDSNGEEEWSKTFGGDYGHSGISIKNTPDGGFIIAGLQATLRDSDMLLIKTDSNGNEQWNKTFGGIQTPGITGMDYGESVEQTTDGGYIIIGTTNCYGNGRADVWLIQVDSMGILDPF